MKALRQAWGLAVALSSLPWLGVTRGWLLDRLFDTFPLLVVVGGLTGVCLGLVCAGDAGSPRPEAGWTPTTALQARRIPAARQTPAVSPAASSPRTPLVDQRQEPVGGKRPAEDRLPSV